MKIGNAVILAAVVVIVAGVAWFRSARQAASGSAAPPSVAPVAATPVAKEGEICPEPPPTSKAGPPPANAAAKKIPRVVDLGADKCIPCKRLAPILEELKKEYAGRVSVEFIDVWKNPRAGDPYKIRVIPTQVFFDADGKEVWRHEGFLPKEDFLTKFAELGVK